MREWRNWQTRTFEGRVVLPYGFKSRFSHHSATDFQWLFYSRQADMAELADALDSGSSECKFMQVQVLLSAPNSINPNLVLVGDGFGFIVFFDYPNFNSKV